MESPFSQINSYMQKLPRSSGKLDSILIARLVVAALLLAALLPLRRTAGGRSGASAQAAQQSSQQTAGPLVLRILRRSRLRLLRRCVLARQRIQKQRCRQAQDAVRTVLVHAAAFRHGLLAAAAQQVQQQTVNNLNGNNLLSLLLGAMQ